MHKADMLYQLTHSTITLTIEQDGNLTRIVWATDDIDDAVSMLDDVFEHMETATPESIQRFVSYSAYTDLAEGAGLYEQ